MLSSGVTEEETVFFESLNSLMETNLITDAVIAQSYQDRSRFWSIREGIDKILSLRPTANFDVSLRVQDIPDYIEKVKTAVYKINSDALVMTFGHLGDNNLHLAISVPEEDAADLAAIKLATHEPVKSLSGSVSAEHGIDREKRAYLPFCKSELELEFMKLLKRSIDPSGLMNPGLILK